MEDEVIQEDEDHRNPRYLPSEADELVSLCQWFTENFGRTPNPTWTWQQAPPSPISTRRRVYRMRQYPRLASHLLLSVSFPL